MHVARPGPCALLPSARHLSVVCLSTPPPADADAAAGLADGLAPPATAYEGGEAAEADGSEDAPRLECRYRGVVRPMKDCLLELFDAVSSHEDAWPFRHAVSVSDAPDYYVIIKNPVDLSLIRKRLHQSGKP